MGSGEGDVRRLTLEDFKRGAKEHQDEIDAAWEAMWESHEDAANLCGFNRLTFERHRTLIERVLTGRTTK